MSDTESRTTHYLSDWQIAAIAESVRLNPELNEASKHVLDELLQRTVAIRLLVEE